MPESFEVSDVVAAKPEVVYEAWLDSAGHSEMTGGEAECSSELGGEFTAWDGYISGRNLELEPHSRIVQSWRTTEFSDSDPDSRLEVLLEPADAGTLVTLRHSNVPDGELHYRDGWVDHYLEPMKEYFSD